MKKSVFFVLLGCMVMVCCSCQNTPVGKSDYSVTLMTLDPGHFHASLVQKSMYPQVNPNVYVYAPFDQEVKDYLAQIEAYNKRPENPTRWQEIVYTEPDYLARMLREAKGNVVVLAGNNRKKTEYIKSCVDARLNVLSDKPMCIHAESFDLLKAAFESAQKNHVLLYDIMTERYEITTILQKELAQTSEVFGELIPGTEQDPSIVKESTHHFFKYVSGNPIKRPGWYFDTTQQGEGMVDVTTHLVDLIMWEAFPEQIIDYTNEVKILDASRWPTMLSKAQYQKVTRLADFPDYLKSQLDKDGCLPCYSNGEFNYTLRGIHAKVSVSWAFEAPAGGGDTHYSVMKGTKASVIIRQGAEQKYKPELYVEPAGETTLEQLGSTLFRMVLNLQSRYPGVMAIKDNARWKIAIPDSYRVGHEAHFAQVMAKYLKFLDAGRLPDWEVPNMLAKYYTTTQALTAAKTVAEAEDKNKAAAEPAIRFGVCASVDKADKIKIEGYDYIEENVQKFLTPQESDEKFAANLEKVKAAKFPVYACNGFLPAALKVTGPQTNHDEILDYARTACRRAKEAGVKRIVFGSGKSRNLPEGFDTQRAYKQFADLLKKIGPIAAQYDVIIVIEPLNSTECNFVNTVAQATAIAKEVNHPNIGVLADFYHMLRENEGPESIIAAGKLLLHCHIAEKEKRTFPGFAGDDFTPYFKALKQIGYTGGISCECDWGDNFQASLPVALKTMKSQMEKTN